MLSFGYFVFYSRTLSPEHTGIYVFAISFVTIFSIGIDLGLNPVLIREVARAKEKTQSYLSTILAIKIFLAVLAYAGIWVTALILGYDILTQEVLWLAGISMVIESFSVTLYGIFRGYQNFRYEATGTIIHQVFVLGFGIVGLVINPSPIILGIAVMLGALANFSYALWHMVRTLKFKVTPRIDLSVIKQFAKWATPFFLAGIFTKLYAYVDIVLLKQMTDDAHVGWYSVAYKLTYAIQFLPLAISNSVFPAFSELYLSSQDKLRRLLEQSYFFMLSIGTPIAAGVFVLAGPLITNPNLWPTYAQSISALQVSILSLPFIFINLIAGTLLGACNKQKIHTINIMITTIVNIVANVILIPQWQHVGASAAALLSALVLFVLSTIWSWKVAKYRIVWLLGRWARSLIASAIMVGILLALGSSLSVFALLPIAAIIYAIAFFLVGGITRTDIQTLYGIIRRRNGATAE